MKNAKFNFLRMQFEHCTTEITDCADCPHRHMCENPIDGGDIDINDAYAALLISADGMIFNDHYYEPSPRQAIAYIRDAAYWLSQGKPPFVPKEHLRKKMFPVDTVVKKNEVQLSF